MPSFWRRWLVGLGLLAGLAACTAPATPSPTGGAAPAASAVAPTATVAPARATPTVTPCPTPSPAPPTPTATPTPRPTPTVAPDAVGFTDALHDPIYCLNGKPALYLLPPELDLWHAAMRAEADPDQNGRCYFVVTVLFAAPLGDMRAAGGVEFYHPDAPLRQPPSRTWFFDNLGYVSLNFTWHAGRGQLETWAEKVFGGRWLKTQTIVGYTGRVDEEGRLILRIPCDAVQPGSTWIVAATGDKGTKCDVLGLGDDGRPALPLPPTPTP